MTRSALDCAIVLGVIAGADERDPTAVTAAGARLCRDRSAEGVKGKRIGRPVNLAASTTTDAARSTARSRCSARPARPSSMSRCRRTSTRPRVDWVPLCAVECAVAHEATYPARASEYGSVLAGLIDAGRRLSGTEVAHLQLRRAALTGALNRLLASVDLLLMPVMPRAVWSLEALAAAGAIPKRWERACATPRRST